MGNKNSHIVSILPDDIKFMVMEYIDLDDLIYQCIQQSSPYLSWYASYYSMIPDSSRLKSDKLYLTICNLPLRKCLDTFDMLNLSDYVPYDYLIGNAFDIYSVKDISLLLYRMKDYIVDSSKIITDFNIRTDFVMGLKLVLGYYQGNVDIESLLQTAINNNSINIIRYLSSSEYLNDEFLDKAHRYIREYHNKVRDISISINSRKDSDCLDVSSKTQHNKSRGSIDVVTENKSSRYTILDLLREINDI